MVLIINELASTYLSSTVAYGFAFGTKPGDPVPYSFPTAMGDTTSTVMVGFRCMPIISDKICNFDIVAPPKPGHEEALPHSTSEVPEIHPLDFADPNMTHSVCNMKTGKCEECDPPSSGMGCVTTDKCNGACKVGPAKDYLYKCNWDGFKCN